MTEEFSNAGHEPAQSLERSAPEAAPDHAAAPPPSPADLLAEVALGVEPAAVSATEPEAASQVEESPGDLPEFPADLLADAALPAAQPEPEQSAEPAQESEAVAAVVEEDAGALPESPADLLAETALSSEPAEQPESAAAEQQPATEVPPKTASAPPQVPHEAIKRPDGPENSPFSVLVSQVYEGPLDLLLDLIRKQDIDIYDIPIAKITAQFLAYVNRLRASDMDVAGEFIYTASLLIHIKSKMLLPREPKGGDDLQEDPRRELVERLLEHERFKNAAQMLQQKQMLEAATWTNPGAREFQTDAGTEPEIAADTTDLVRIFQEILERARRRPIINVQEDSVTVGQMIQFLGRRLTMEDRPVALRRLLANTKSERALIAMFLALLELVRLQAILLRQDQHFSEIFIKKNTGFEAVMNDGMARDDWQ